MPPGCSCKTYGGLRVTQQSDCCGTTYEGEIEVRSSSAGIRPLELLEGMGTSFSNHWHYDPEHHRRELDVFWYSMWVYVCRSEEVSSHRGTIKSSRSATRTSSSPETSGDNVRAFHNTCRHRGSILCTQERGPVRGRLHRLPVPCLDLLAGRRPDRHAAPA